MSNKFEQLLDYLVNEEMDKANELFHEIVVEKSRDIYETIISEEEEEEQVELPTDDESVEEGSYDQEEYEEAFDADEEEGDASDKSLADIEMDGDSEMGGDMGPADSEDDAMMDIKNAIEEIEAAFAQLKAAKGDDSDMDSDSEFDDTEDDVVAADDELDSEEGKMGQFEGRRITREYVEKVGTDWDRNGQKTQGQSAGADSGDKMGSPSETKSPVNTKAAATAPKTGAHAGNILGDQGTGEGTNVGTTPAGKAGGLVKNAQDMKTGNGNVPGGNMGIKNLAKVAGGHGAEKKGAAPGPVGSGTGDKAGQTTVSNGAQFLKKL